MLIHVGQVHLASPRWGEVSAKQTERGPQLFHIPIQERHDLPSGASGIRGEMRGICSVCDPFAYCPQHRGVVVLAAAHIHEGIRGAGRRW